MKKSIAYIALCLLMQLSFGQLIIKPIKQKVKSLEIRSPQLDINPAMLPFWDDFAITNGVPDSLRVWNMDTTLQWDPAFSRGVFVNNTLAINPPSYRTATFDGLDEIGNFYVADNDATGRADFLVSANIDLSSKTQNDSVYLSFYWQAGGNVEIPEEADSLALQFMPADSSGWITKWWRTGGEELDNTTFQQEFIYVSDTFLSENFRFRFFSAGDLDGPFDAWHVDWIYLNENRTVTKESEGYVDGSLTGQLTSLLSPFQSMPANQFGGDNSFIRNQKIGIRSLNLLPGDPGIFGPGVTYTLENTNDNSIIVQDLNRVFGILAPSRKLDTLVSLMLTDTASNPIILSEQNFDFVMDFDSVVLRSEVYLQSSIDVINFLDGTVVDLRANDTLRQDYLLHDYYAYDDGSAEFAAGTNIRNGQVAVEYWLEEQDTLTHVDINFPNISPILQSAPSLSLNIMTDLTENGLLRTQQITVTNGLSRNGFTRYELDRPVILSDTFYIGYQQFINDYIGIGFDRSNPEASSHIFENKDGEWIQNVSLTGALMIRPVFKNNVELVLSAEPEKEFTVYPNPTSGRVKIGQDYDSVELLDLSGKILLREERGAYHDFSKFQRGLYLLRIRLKNAQTVQKIILK